MAFAGTVDINHIAVWEAIDRYEVEDPVRVFEKIILMARHLYAEEQRDAKLKSNKDMSRGTAIR